MSACATQTPTNGANKQTAAPSFTPRVDVWETEQEYLFHADMPGVQPGDISLQFENGQLKLHGKVHPKPCCQGKLQNEYAVGDYERQFAINDEVEISKINADYKNGVLTVKLPKKEEVKPKKIEITV